MTLKTTAILATSLIQFSQLMMAQSVFAQAAQQPSGPDLNQMPYLIPSQCADQVRRPTNGANGYLYYSKDCKTAFVLPRTRGTMEISEPEFGPSVTPSTCAAVDATITEVSPYLKTLTEYETVRLGIAQGLLTATTQEQIASINERMAILDSAIASAKKNINDILSSYDDIEGYHFSVLLSTDVASDIEAYVDANSGATTGKSRIRFEAAPIRNGLITFFPANALTGPNGPTAAKMRAIMSLGVAGLSLKDSDQYSVSANHITSNEGLSGKVILTLPGSCSIIRTANTVGSKTEIVYDLTKTKTWKTAGALMVANFTYEIPVMTSIGVTADVSIKPKNLQSSIVHQASMNPAMNRSDFITRVLEGDLQTSFKFQYTSAVTADQLDKIKTKTGSLKWDLMYSFKQEVYDMVMDKLELMRYITKKPANDMTIASVNPVSTATTVMQRRCERVRSGASAGWGLWDGGEQCHDVPVVVYILATGSAVTSDQITDTSSVTVHHEITFDEAVAVVHSSSFKSQALQETKPARPAVTPARL